LTVTGYRAGTGGEWCSWTRTEQSFLIVEDDYSYYETMTIGMTCDTRLIGAYPSRLADSRAAVRAVGF